MTAVAVPALGQIFLESPLALLQTVAKQTPSGKCIESHDYPDYASGPASCELTMKCDDCGRDCSPAASYTWIAGNLVSEDEGGRVKLRGGNAFPLSGIGKAVANFGPITVAFCDACYTAARMREGKTRLIPIGVFAGLAVLGGLVGLVFPVVLGWVTVFVFLLVLITVSRLGYFTGPFTRPTDPLIIYETLKPYASETATKSGRTHLWTPVEFENLKALSGGNA